MVEVALCLIECWKTRWIKDFIRSLNNDLHFFDFTSEYLKNKELSNLDSFALNNTDWRSFKQFMQGREAFTKTKEAWNNLEQIAKEKGAETSFKSLEKEFKNQLAHVLDQNWRHTKKQ